MRSVWWWWFVRLMVLLGTLVALWIDWEVVRAGHRWALVLEPLILLYGLGWFVNLTFGGPGLPNYLFYKKRRR